MGPVKPSEREHVRIAVRVEKRVVDVLDEIAASLGVKRATLIRMLLLNYIATLQRPPEPQPTPLGLWGMRGARGSIRPDEGRAAGGGTAEAAVGVRVDGG
jgi:hypothetical protein